MKATIVNIGTIISGDWRNPFVTGDSILMSGGKLQKVGTVSTDEIKDCDLVIDANGVTAVPGFIDYTCTSRSATIRRG